jgi:hypothetical protein
MLTITDGRRNGYCVQSPTAQTVPYVVTNSRRKKYSVVKIPCFHLGLGQYPYNQVTTGRVVFMGKTKLFIYCLIDN